MTPPSAAESVWSTVQPHSGFSSGFLGFLLQTVLSHCFRICGMTQHYEAVLLRQVCTGVLTQQEVSCWNPRGEEVQEDHCVSH